MTPLPQRLREKFWTNGLGDWPDMSEELIEALIACVEALERRVDQNITSYSLDKSALARLREVLGEE